MLESECIILKSLLLLSVQRLIYFPGDFVRALTVTHSHETWRMRAPAFSLLSELVFLLFVGYFSEHRRCKSLHSLLDSYTSISCYELKAILAASNFPTTFLPIHSLRTRIWPLSNTFGSRGSSSHRQRDHRNPDASQNLSALTTTRKIALSSSSWVH